MPAPKVTVYTRDHCPFCVRAKALLARKGVSFDEIHVEGKDELREWLAEQTGQMTLPQVFAGERSLGGYSDLAALDGRGELDRILAGDA